MNPPSRSGSEESCGCWWLANLGRTRLTGPAGDAVVWPLLWVLLIRQVPGPAGLVGPFVTALAVLLGLGRLHRALWENHRYWFSTWSWGKVLGPMLGIGAVLKIAMSV